MNLTYGSQRSNMSVLLIGSFWSCGRLYGNIFITLVGTSFYSQRTIHAEDLHNGGETG